MLYLQYTAAIIAYFHSDYTSKIFDGQGPLIYSKLALKNIFIYLI